MLAKAVDGVPAADSVPGGLAYEPKWDGFRCLVVRDGDEIELASRGSKPLTRYFPEVVEDVRRLLPQKCVIDAEIVVRTGPSGAERLHWENLSARIHPALSRITKLSVEAPAELVCFDLLALGDVSLLDLPFRDRRAWLEKALTGLSQNDPIHLSQVTTDAAVARDWFERFEGAGLDGVVAKPLQQPYAPGRRTMLKVKHHRSADAVVYGYRIHKSGQGVGSLLLGLFTDEDGEDKLVPVGGIAAFSNARRLELVEELAPLVLRDDDGNALRPDGGPALPACRDVPAVASGPGADVLPARPGRAGSGLRPRRGAGDTLTRLPRCAKKGGHLRELEERGDGDGVRVAQLGVAPSIEQVADDLRRAAEHRRGEGGLPPVVDAGRVGAALEQGPDELGVLVVGGEDEQRVALAVRQVHRQPAVEQAEHRCRLALSDEVEHGGEEVQLCRGQLLAVVSAGLRGVVHPIIVGGSARRPARPAPGGCSGSSRRYPPSD